MADESAIEGTICRWAEMEGWTARKLKYIGRRAAADRLFYGHGRLVLIEFKDPDGELSALQVQEFKRMTAARVVGTYVFVVDNLAEGCRVLGLRWPR